ncbi:15288_t:CDS:2, partial [Racocetra fulgida]
MNTQDSLPSLTVNDFFKLSFGLTPIELDPTKFVTNELTIEMFASLIEPSLREQNPAGIFRNLFPYLVDTISRTVPISRLVNYIQELNENNEDSDIYQILQRFEECTGRDFLIAFLDKVPKNSFSKILHTIVAANIPIPLYLSNDTHSQKGLKTLNGVRDIIASRKYHLFISVNQANTDLELPFSKQLYKNYANNREDLSGICNPNSIDISFHSASENHSRPPLAISEVYYGESGSSTLRETVKILSKFAFYIIIHVSNNDFDGNELNDRFISTINDISIECSGGHIRKILTLFWGVTPQFFKNHKEKIEKLSCKTFTNDEFGIELVVNNKKNALFERIKKDSFYKLKDTKNLRLDWTSMNFSKILSENTEDFLLENDFALSMAKLETFNCRADIFYASYCENEIETLRDKTDLKTKTSAGYQTEAEIYRLIQKFQDEKKNFGETRPIPVLTYFANVITKNDIKYMREFARQADVYFKDYLISLAQKDNEIKNNSAESDQTNRQRKEIKQKIEDLDITVHDFWREFVILSHIMRSDGSLVLKKLYDIDDKQLEKAYNIWIREGEAIQILEGVSLRTLNSDFLSSVLSQIMSNSKRQLVVLSVIGLESSGKSTLLNYLFQCGFSTSAGRFVLRDMIDAKRAQAPAFIDICESLKRMFDEIPGCSYDMDEFMIVEERDVHLLENAFTCSFDDFYPQSMNTDCENFRLWKEIDARGNFLHFKNSKTIQQWRAMKKIVHSYNETTVKSYKEKGLNLIERRRCEEQWNEANDKAFEDELIQETETWCTNTIADFKEKISNQYEPQIIDEGETYIKAAFAAEKRELKAIYAKRQRQSKESWLITSAETRIGETVGRILRENKDKTPEEFKRIFSKSKCEKLFNDEWKKVENDKEGFMRIMIMEAKKLEEHVVNYFNNAVVSGRAISNDESNLKERSKFDRIFWNKIKTPETLNTVSLDDEQFPESIKLSRTNKINIHHLGTYVGINDGNKSSFKDEVIKQIKSEIENTCKQICDDLLFRNAFAIEFGQALEWLKKLCNNIFIAQANLNLFQGCFKVEIEDFSLMENNTAKWKDTQQRNLENLRESLRKHFHEILKALMSEQRNPTRVAYERSFGAYDVEKTRKYIHDPTSFMRELFEPEVDVIKTREVDGKLKDIKKNIYCALEKLSENISVLQHHFSTESSDRSFTLEEIFQKTNVTLDAKNENISSQEISSKSLIEDAIRVLGKCIIDSPRDFCAILKKEYSEFLLNFKRLWINECANHRKLMINKVEYSKESYWNKPENFNIYYVQGDNKDDRLIWEENMKKNHPEWWPLLGRKEPGDDQIRQVRTMWVHLKAELCSKYNLVDKTPANWHRDYAHLAKN